MPRRDAPPESRLGSRQPGLWELEACAAWDTALDAYPDALEASGGGKLRALDRWYHLQWPADVRARQPLAVTRDELLQVIRWKMGRGVWRERNLRLAETNQAADVARCTEAALAAVPDMRRPLDSIASLRGVGVATASAVLAALYPAHYPFLDDVVGAQVPELGAPAFTMKYYLAYAAALRDRATQLSRQCTHREWTAHAVGLALWSAASAAERGHDPGGAS